MLESKVILITGAAGGIGRATAIAAAREGAKLALVDLNLEGAQETASILSGSGAQAFALRADIGNADQVNSMVTATVEHFGRLDAAFNNAAVAQWQVGAGAKKLADIEEAAFVQIMQTNVIGTWLCMRAELQHMSQHGGGAIVNASSFVGLVGRAGTGAYSTSKHAINGLTRSAALDYAASGVRINAVCPGYVDTGFLKAHGAALETTVPLGRLATPKDVAEMVVWLLSDRAAYVTGSLFGVDGGLMAG
jgi:NAD(P)-dependent dehydrogenase (short-subunit alcohol dehydrogenase family)